MLKVASSWPMRLCMPTASSRKRSLMWLRSRGEFHLLLSRRGAHPTVLSVHAYSSMGIALGAGATGVFTTSDKLWREMDEAGWKTDSRVMRRRGRGLASLSRYSSLLMRLVCRCGGCPSSLRTRSRSNRRTRTSRIPEDDPPDPAPLLSSSRVSLSPRLPLFLFLPPRPLTFVMRRVRGYPHVDAHGHSRRHALGRRTSSPTSSSSSSSPLLLVRSFS